MSGIVAAAQSAGCCCRPVEGCTCGDPNRPGAVFDRQLTAIAVTGEVTVDHAIRRNGSPSVDCGCPCFPVGGETYGTGAVRYGYRSPGSVVDPDGLVPGDPCYPGCTNAGCGGCPAYSVSANVSTIVCPQAFPGTASWTSDIRTFGENMIAAWTWQGRQVGYCTSLQGVRVRSCCMFLGQSEGTTTLASLTGYTVDSCGAFVNPETGAYVQTPYGDTLGRLHMIQYARLDASGFTIPNQCRYTVRIGVTWAFTWEILKALAEDGVWPSQNAPALDGYYADYFKPCLSPTDTALGRYAIGDVPNYDRSSVDQECGRIRAFEDLRVTFPQTVEVS